jgi:hypothetical protein
MEYRVFASRIEDVNLPGVWITYEKLLTRSVVSIRNKTNGQAVYCEAFVIEDNFIADYNSKPKRKPIDKPQPAIVISAWYRKLLGIPNTRVDVVLEIAPADKTYGRLRAWANHPDNAVRSSLYIALISLLLGVFGLVLGIISLVPRCSS